MLSVRSEDKVIHVPIKPVHDGEYEASSLIVEELHLIG